MTISKTALVGVLLLGIVLGGAGASLFLRSCGPEDATASRESTRKGERSSGERTVPSGGSPALSPRDASEELGRWLHQADSEEGFDRIKLLLGRAAEWSPQTTMEQAMLIENPYRRREAVQRLFRYWISSDRDGALEAIGKMDNVALQRDVYRDAMRWLAEDDPEAAIDILKKKGNLQDAELWSRSFGIWAREDRDRAVEEILSLENEGLRDQVLRSVAQRMAAGNLAEAIAWAESLSEGHSQAALLGVLQQGAESDPAGIAAHLEKLPAGRLRDEILARAADEWAERDPDAALAWAETLDEAGRERAIGEIAERVLQTDPTRAEELLEELPDSERRNGVLEQIARLRAGVDLQGALEWIDSLSAHDQERAWAGVAREWARFDPQGAAAHAAGVDDPAVARQLVGAAAYSWAQRDPAGAAEWASTLEGSPRDSALQRIMETWSRDDPAAAGEFVVHSLDGDLQASMTRQVVGRWMRNDVSEASAWIDTLPDGQARDGAIYTLISSIEDDFPETALLWARTISDDRKREGAERRIQRRLGQ